MQNKLITMALVFGLSMFTVLWFGVYTFLFLTKDLHQWYYDWFRTDMKQIIAILIVPIGALLTWTIERVLNK